MLKRFFSKPKQAQYGWFGNYSAWAEVSAKAGGYNEDVILERTKNAMLKIKSGEAVYERDSVLFDKKQHPYPLLAFLFMSASLQKRPLNIIDFGGSLGTTYYQLLEFLDPSLCKSWNIVEQKHYVACGKANFENDVLRFYNSIDDCLEEKKIDLVILSSSVQYLEKPHEFLKKLAEYNFDFVIFDRTAFNNEMHDRLTLQIVPPDIYPASYPAWFLNMDFFLTHFSGKYKIAANFPSYVEGESTLLIDGVPAGSGQGFYLINRSKYA